MNMRFAFAALAFVASDALAHGGGLNAEGCHNTRKTGDYHCHRAPSVAAIKGAQQAQPAVPQGAAAPSAARAAATPNPSGPTCHVGPRGGTYTITKSGKKNYSGC